MDTWTVKSGNVVVRQEMTEEGTWSYWSADFRKSKPKALASVFRGYKFRQTISLLLFFGSGPNETQKYLGPDDKPLIHHDGLVVPNSENRCSFDLNFKKVHNPDGTESGGTRKLITTQDRLLTVLSMTCDDKGTLYLMYWPLGAEGIDRSEYPNYFEGYIMV